MRPAVGAKGPRWGCGVAEASVPGLLLCAERRFELETKVYSPILLMSATVNFLRLSALVRRDLADMLNLVGVDSIRTRRCGWIAVGVAIGVRLSGSGILTDPPRGK